MAKSRPKSNQGYAGKPKRWQLQEAKAKFSRVFDLALTQGPQRVTRRDKDAVVVIREADYERLANPKERPSLIEALLACPRVPGFKIPERDRTDRVPKDPPLFR